MSSDQKFITLYRNIKGMIKVTKNGDKVNFTQENTKVVFIDKIPLTINNQFILDKWVPFMSIDVNPVKVFLHWLNKPGNKEIAEKILRVFRILGDIYLVNSKHPATKMLQQFMEEIKRNNWENLKYLTEECAKGNMLKDPILMLLEYNSCEYQKHKDDYINLCTKLNVKPLDLTGTKFVQHFTDVRVLSENNKYDMSQHIEDNIKKSSTSTDKGVLGGLSVSANARPKADAEPLEPTDHEVKILQERVDPHKGHELLIQGTTSLHTKKEIKEFEQQGYVVQSMTKSGRKWQVVWKDSWVSAKYIYLEQLRDGVASNNTE